ncbi:MAG: putative leader peptide [Haloechinothrix sp.]
MATHEVPAADGAASAVFAAVAVALVQRRHVDLLRVNSALCRR